MKGESDKQQRTPVPITRLGFGQSLAKIAAATAVPNLLDNTFAETQNPVPTTGGSDQLCDLSAVELAARIRRREVSARDVMAAHLARIERLNPKVNAVVTLVAERAMAEAKRADELAARGGHLGVLHGLPVAHKDLVDTAGIRTTYDRRSIAPTYRLSTPPS